MDWLEVCVATDGEAAEAVAEYLSPYAINNGVVLEQLGDPQSPLPNRLLPTINVKIYIPRDEFLLETKRKIEEIIFHLGTIYPIPEPSYRELADEDWAILWREHFKPFRIGHGILIKPSWVDSDLTQENDITITLDPGMAFGTGLHPSTKMCLEALEDLVNVDDRVLDVGTGSGILAIAAVKLGAASAFAFDTDGMAAVTACNNAIINEISDDIQVYQGHLGALRPRPWNLVVVNILAPVILSLLVDGNLLDYAEDSGRLILSGIIQDQVNDLEMTLERLDGEIEQRLQSGDWTALIVRKKAPVSADLPGAGNNE